MISTPPQLYGNSRLNRLIASGKADFSRLQILDCYNQRVYDRIFPTMTTRIDSSNMYFISEPIDEQDSDHRTDT